MEPLAIQSGVSQTVRPVLSLDGNLTAVLREGRTVAGEVLQTLDGKSVLIGVGRHRVPADSQVELKPGDRFLARVEQSAEGTVLKVLGGKSGAESNLLVALRSVVGNDLPAGELLDELGGALKRAIARGEDGDGKLAKLMKSLGEHVFVPGANGEELRRLLAQSGLDHEAIMTELANKPEAGKSGAMLQDLAGKLFDALRGALSAAGVNLSKEVLAKLRAQIEGIVGEVAESLERGASHESLKRGLTARMNTLLGSLPEGPAREALLGSLPGTLANVLGSGSPTQLAQALMKAISGEADLRMLENNLKAQLLTALSEVGEGSQKQAIQRALAGIEAEQLLNVARKEFSEGWHLSLPIPDGDHHATANLFYRDSQEQGEDGEHDEHELQRMTLTVDFSRIGPLRAELGVRDDLVALRLVVTKPEVATAIEGGIDELTEKLSLGGREARVAVILGTPEDAAVDALNQNIRWLQEHHLMDLKG